MKRTIAVIAGGDSAEFKISLQTANHIFSTLDTKKYIPYLVILKGTDWKVKIDDQYYAVDRNDFSFTTQGEKVKFDFAYIGIHGTPGENGRVGHEMIFDCREFNKSIGITDIDIAKRLMDYGFHAPTLSFPVHGTLMVEPTESEPLEELDRFIEALAKINEEMKEIEDGVADTSDNVLKNAPHTHMVLTADEWNHTYNRKKAAYPLKWVADTKFWPSVGRVDDAFGDRNLMCTCAPLEAYNEEYCDCE